MAKPNPEFREIMLQMAVRDPEVSHHFYSACGDLVDASPDDDVAETFARLAGNKLRYYDISERSDIDAVFALGLSLAKQEHTDG
ncbi:MAG TPA: hypothetical protein VLE69_03905 [Candidatus Saccharimonadales bacterium]|nr:hypothetical protein [Candidatus Saccharimonadales bacterium]